MSNILNGYADYKILNNPIMSKYRSNNNYEWLIHLIKKSWMPLIYIYEQDINCPLSYSQSRTKNPDWIPIKPRSKMLAFRDKYYKVNTMMHPSYSFREEYWMIDSSVVGYHTSDEEVWQKHFTLKELQQYLGCEPLGNWVMINISPNWKGKVITQHKVDTLDGVIKQYLSEGWYSSGAYVLESGGEGNMLHAHLVLRYDDSPKSIKSAKSHLAKGNHSQQLNKYWNKDFKGDQGLIKGKYAIQKIFLNANEMILDKLAYLEESKKPDGHQNLEVKGIKGLNTKKEWKV